MGTSPEGESFNPDGNGSVFYQGRTDFGFRFPTVRLFTTEPKRFADKGDILMSVRAPVGDINIAEELTEDTFVLLGTKKPKDKGKSTFKTWLYTIGRNVAIDYLRRNSRKYEVSIDECKELSSEEESLELSYLREERKIIVHQAIRKLKSEYQQILWLIYL